MTKYNSKYWHNEEDGLVGSIADVPVENPLEAILNAIVFSSEDYGNDKRKAWIYGIVCGWDKFDDFKKKFGWDDETIERLQRLHKRYIEAYKLLQPNFNPNE